MTSVLIFFSKTWQVRNATTFQRLFEIITWTKFKREHRNSLL